MSVSTPLQVLGIEVSPKDLMFSKFRKLPVVIEAVKMDRSFTVDSLEGTHQGNPGDYLICGVKGELYLCKPDIFEMTYEEV